MNASYQASLVNRHIRRFTGFYLLQVHDFSKFRLKDDRVALKHI